MLQPIDAMVNRWTRRSSESSLIFLSVSVIPCRAQNSGGDEVGKNDAEGRRELMKPTSSSNEKVAVVGIVTSIGVVGAGVEGSVVTGALVIGDEAV